MSAARPIIFLTVIFACVCCSAQQQILSIVTSNSSATPVSYTGIKGAGLRNASNALSSNWDSTGTNFTINYCATAVNITSVTQFTVNGHPRPFITWPINATVKLRRLGNAYVNDTRNYYNFWSVASSLPATGATSGTFNLLAPEITSPEAAFISNNINSGYDNIFQNTISSLHANNIERVDYILPGGLKPKVQLDVDGAGPVVFDRGAGDPFKIALILSLDNNGDPLTFGPLVSVNASQFGPDLKASPSNYCIVTHDPDFGSASRPSTTQTQNMRGVFMSLGDLGLAVNQYFYGYALFGTDVATAVTDWTTYPNNTNSGSQLDPVNVISIFKDVNSLLPVPLSFDLIKYNDKPVLQFTLYNDPVNETVAVERSLNGRDFEEIGQLSVMHTGQFRFTDAAPVAGTVYYRLRVIEINGTTGYSETLFLRLNERDQIQLSPNPVRDELNIRFPAGWQQKDITAVLFNATGARIQERRFTAITSVKKIQLGKIKTGTYFLQLRNEFTGQVQVKQIMVSN
jgi:hypothetical protein